MPYCSETTHGRRGYVALEYSQGEGILSPPGVWWGLMGLIFVKANDHPREGPHDADRH